MGQCVGKPVFAGLQITRGSLLICAVWSAPLLNAYYKISYLTGHNGTFNFLASYYCWADWFEPRFGRIIPRKSTFIYAIHYKNSFSVWGYFSVRFTDLTLAEDIYCDISFNKLGYALLFQSNKQCRSTIIWFISRLIFHCILLLWTLWLWHDDCETGSFDNDSVLLIIIHYISEHWTLSTYIITLT